MKTNSLNPFTALAVSPLNVSLEVQEEEEKIELVIRRHIITNAQWLFIAVVFGLIPLFIYSSLGQNILQTQHFINVISLKGQMVFLVLWYVVISLYVLQNIIVWFFNVLIVTDKRVIDLDVSWPFHRAVTEARLTQVEDVSFRQTGFFANIFNYGNVNIQTAGIKQDIEIERIPDPAFVHDKVTDFLHSEP